MILVTGATGFIGSALVWELNQRGRTDLLVSDHIEPKDRSDHLRKRTFKDFVPADHLTSHLSTVAKDLEAVFHMGACSSTTEKNAEYLRKNNTEYTRHLFEFCTKHQIPFQYASSGAVYGDGSQGFCDRTDPESFTPLIFMESPSLILIFGL